MQQSKLKNLPNPNKGSQVGSTELEIIRQKDDLLIDARLLHKRLNSKRQFSNWIQDRIKEYGFVEGIDFCLTNLLSKKKGRGGHNAKDYFLTLDMAKEIAMLERNETGRQIRRYFIQAEKKARGVSVLPKEKEVFKGIETKKINDRKMYPMDEVKEKLGYKTRGASGGEKDRYSMHFVKEGRTLYITEEYAIHKFHSKRVYNNRNALKAMQPVLPFNFGDNSVLPEYQNKGGRK